jgi:hypothetical protein
MFIIYMKHGKQIGKLFVFHLFHHLLILLVLSREWIGLGVAGMIITSDEMDHSRTFPA